MIDDAPTLEHRTGARGGGLVIHELVVLTMTRAAHVLALH